MDIELRFEKLDPDDALRAHLEDRLARFTRRLRVPLKGRITIRGGWTSTGVIAEIESGTQRFKFAGAGTDAASALDNTLREFVRHMRHAAWKTDGLPTDCTWCGGQTFIHVREARDKTDNSSGSRKELLYSSATNAWHGELDALVCRTCGKVEWFVEDPDAIPIGAEHGTAELSGQPKHPYR